MNKKNRKIVMMFSPAPEGAIYNHDAGGGVGTIISELNAKIFPPMGALYSASVLRSSGYEVCLLDANAYKYTLERCIYMCSDAVNDQDDVVFVLFGSLVSLPSDLFYSVKLRIAFPDSIIIYASTVAHLFVETIISSGVSNIISGDIEASVENAIDNLGPAPVLFRSFLSAKEQNLLPKPAWDLIDIDYYTSYTLLASRGCNFGCPHCPYHVYQRSVFVGRSVASVSNEIRWLKDKFDTDYFLFRDPCFSYNMYRSEKIAHEITVYFGTSLKWGCETRPECLTEELIKKFSEAGCHHIRMGIESANSVVIEDARNIPVNTNSGDYLAHATNVIAWCQKYGIKSVCFFIVGFPKDSHSTTEEIKEFVISANPDIALASYLIPYPDTSYTKKLLEAGEYIPDDWSIYGSKDEPVLPTKYLNLEELKQKKTKLDKFFSSRNRQFYPIR